VQSNVTLTNREADPRIPIGEYAAALVRHMAAHWPELEVVEAREVRIGDDPGVHVEVEWKGTDGRQRSIARIVLREQKLWSLTATTPVNKLDETKATVDRAMRSFVTLK